MTFTLSQYRTKFMQDLTSSYAIGIYNHSYILLHRIRYPRTRAVHSHIRKQEIQIQENIQETSEIKHGILQFRTDAIIP